MGLTRDVLDSLGAQLDDALGHAAEGGLLEYVTYAQKSNETSTIAIHTNLEVRLRGYRLAQLTTDLVLPEDREARIASRLVTWEPSVYDTFTRINGEVWKVVSASGGPGHVRWRLQVRKVG